jgi:hypothetical protein
LSNSTASTSATTGALVVTGGAGITGNLSLGANILLSGSPGTNGQFLSTTGTGLQWVTLSASSISNSTSNVTVASGGGVSFGIASANVVVVGATGIVPNSNVSYNLGDTTHWFNTFYGLATQAKYADLAENYQADAAYEPGTVLVFGGSHEVTTTTASHDERVAGVVSTNPAHLMNGGLQGENVVALGLTGRLPCRVQGPVAKGTVLVTGTTPGVAQAIDNSQFRPGCVLGKALESINTNNIDTIEIVVGRF